MEMNNPAHPAEATKQGAAEEENWFWSVGSDLHPCPGLGPGPGPGLAI